MAQTYIRRSVQARTCLFLGYLDGWRVNLAQQQRIWRASTRLKKGVTKGWCRTLESESSSVSRAEVHISATSELQLRQLVETFPGDISEAKGKPGTSVEAERLLW